MYINSNSSDCKELGPEDSDPDWEESIKKKPDPPPDKGAKWLPLVYQEHNKTRILEQPLDFTTLAQKYSNFATTFIENHQDSPFFLYVPFSHVHCTAWASTKEKQYAGCDFQGATERGSFGDDLADSNLGDEGLVALIAPCETHDALRQLTSLSLGNSSISDHGVHEFTLACCRNLSILPATKTSR